MWTKYGLKTLPNSVNEKLEIYVRYLGLMPVVCSERQLTGPGLQATYCLGLSSPDLSTRSGLTTWDILCSFLTFLSLYLKGACDRWPQFFHIGFNLVCISLSGSFRTHPVLFFILLVAFHSWRPWFFFYIKLYIVFFCCSFTFQLGSNEQSD